MRGCENAIFKNIQNDFEILVGNIKLNPGNAFKLKKCHQIQHKNVRGTPLASPLHSSCFVIATYKALLVAFKIVVKLKMDANKRLIAVL